MKEKKEKIINLVMAASMVLMGLCTTVSGITNVAGIQLPDIFARIMGYLQLFSLVTMIYSTAMKFLAMRSLPVSLPAEIPAVNKENENG